MFYFQKQLPLSSCKYRYRTEIFISKGLGCMRSFPTRRTRFPKPKRDKSERDEKWGKKRRPGQVIEIEKENKVNTSLDATSQILVGMGPAAIGTRRGYLAENTRKEDPSSKWTPLCASPVSQRDAGTGERSSFTPPLG